jgi:hypothetical protein
MKHIHKKMPKPSQKPDAKHRDHVGMKRYPCRSNLVICYYAINSGYEMRVMLQHHVKHVLYVDVLMPPEARQIIEEHAEW